MKVWFFNFVDFLKRIFMYSYNHEYKVHFYKFFNFNLGWFFVVAFVFGIVFRFFGDVASSSISLSGFSLLFVNLGNLVMIISFIPFIFVLLLVVFRFYVPEYAFKIRVHKQLIQFCDDNGFVVREKESYYGRNLEGKEVRKERDVLVYAPNVFYFFDNRSLTIMFRLDGHKLSKNYDKLGDLLASMFILSLEKEEVKKGYAVYIFRRNVIERENVSNILDVVSDNKIRLSESYIWNFRTCPHGLVSGVTGSGKTYLFAYFIIMFIKLKATFKIVDPKRADLYYLEKYFGDSVVCKKNQALRLLRESCELIDTRMSGFRSRSDYAFGKDYYDYNIRPYFIVFDEAAAFVAMLDNKLKEEFDEYIAKIILEGRQAGVFVIFAMQRADTEFIKGAFRDQLGLRIALGAMSNDGYKMVFGKLERNLVLENPDAGFIKDLKMVEPHEFFTPYLDVDFISELEDLINWNDNDGVSLDKSID